VERTRRILIKRATHLEDVHGAIHFEASPNPRRRQMGGNLSSEGNGRARQSRATILHPFSTSGNPAEGITAGAKQLRHQPTGNQRVVRRDSTKKDNWCERPWGGKTVRDAILKSDGDSSPHKKTEKGNKSTVLTRRRVEFSKTLSRRGIARV